MCPDVNPRRTAKMRHHALYKCAASSFIEFGKRMLHVNNKLTDSNHSCPIKMLSQCCPIIKWSTHALRLSACRIIVDEWRWFFISIGITASRTVAVAVHSESGEDRRRNRTRNTSATRPASAEPVMPAGHFCQLQWRRFHLFAWQLIKWARLLLLD